jgi:hypothetical protein
MAAGVAAAACTDAPVPGRTGATCILRAQRHHVCGASFDPVKRIRQLLQGGPMRVNRREPSPTSISIQQPRLRRMTVTQSSLTTIQP